MATPPVVLGSKAHRTVARPRPSTTTSSTATAASFSIRKAFRRSKLTGASKQGRRAPQGARRVSFDHAQETDGVYAHRASHRGGDHRDSRRNRHSESADCFATVETETDD